MKNATYIKKSDEAALKSALAATPGAVVYDGGSHWMVSLPDAAPDVAGSPTFDCVLPAGHDPGIMYFDVYYTLDGTSVVESLEKIRNRASGLDHRGMHGDSDGSAWVELHRKANAAAAKHLAIRNQANPSDKRSFA